MFDWLIKKMVELVIGGASYFISLLTTTFNFDLTYFSEQFTLVADSYKLFQTMALGFVMLFLIWQSLKTFGLPLGIEGDDPLKVFLKSMIAVFCIYNAQRIFNIGFEILRPIFDQISGMSALDNIWDAEKGYTAANGVLEVAKMFTGLGLLEILIYATLLIVMMFNLLKMLIELTERYILIGILAVTSPLGFSTMTNKGTANIFSAWVRMVIGQFVIYLLNFWIIKLFLNSMTSMPAFAGSSLEKGGVVVWFVFMWAFLRVAQKLDQFLGKLGIEVGNVGGSLMEEIMIAKPAFSALGKAVGFGGKGDGLAAAMRTAAGGGGAGGGASGIAASLARGAAVGAGGALGHKVMSGVGKVTKNSPLGGLFTYGNPLRGVGTAAAQGKTTLGRFGRGAQQVGANVANATLKVDKFKGGSIAKALNTSPNGGGVILDQKLQKLTTQNGVAENIVNKLSREVDGERGKTITQGLMNGKSFGDLTPEMVKSDAFKATAYNGGVKWQYDDGRTMMDGVLAVHGKNDAIKDAEKLLKTDKSAYNYVSNAPGGRKTSCVYSKKTFEYLDNNAQNKN